MKIVNLIIDYVDIFFSNYVANCNNNNLNNLKIHLTLKWLIAHLKLNVFADVGHKLARNEGATTQL